jgi:hypothetical protein
MSSEWSPPNSQSGAPTADLTQLMPLVEESWRRLKTNPGPVAIGLVTGMGVSSIGMMFIYIAIFGVMFVGVLAGAALSAALGMSEDAAAGISSLFMVLAMLVIYPLLFGFIMAAQVIKCAAASSPRAAARPTSERCSQASLASPSRCSA